MQNYNHNLGEVQGVFRPLTLYIWGLSAIATGPLALISLTAFLTLDAFTSDSAVSREKTSEAVSNALTCLGFAGIPLIAVVLVIISEIRKWYPTRKDKLTIYQSGFTYENKDRVEVCRWEEIRDVNFRFVPTYSQAIYNSKAKVIRSIVKTDGTVISFAETLNLVKITNLIPAAKGKL